MPIKLKHKGAWHEIASLSNTTGTTKVALLKDEKDEGVQGGSFTQGGWKDRNLTVEEDPQGFVSFTAGGPTSSIGTQNEPGYWSLAAGTYLIEWSAPAHNVTKHQSLLVYSTTSSHISTAGLDASASYVEGSSEDITAGGSGGDQSISVGSKVITTTATTWFKIMHRCEVDAFGEGMGQDTPGWGTKEIYTQVRIQDLSTAVLKSTSTGTTKVAKVEDVKAYDEGGGEATPASKWVVRNLNTITDPHSVGITSTDLGRMSIPAGTYRFNWRAPAYAVKRHTSRLVYSTDSTLGVGNSTALYASANYEHHEGVDHDQGWSMGIIPSVTFSSTTYFQIEHQIQIINDDNDNGWGVNSGISGVDSIYTTVEVEDLSTAVKDKASDGKVINVWNVTYDGKQLIDTETWEDISDLTVTLTPRSASSKFLITAVVNAGMNSGGDDCMVRLVRGSTVIGSINAEYDTTHGTRTTGFGQIAGQQGYTGIQAVVITYLDTPNTASPLTYHIEGINLNDGHNLLVNYRGAGTFTTTSHMTITEIRP